MITFVEGRLVEKQPTRAVLNVSGVGYELHIPLSTYDHLPGVDDSCRVLTHDHIREDAHTLFGFATETERSMFEMLLGISGVGPRIALSALSGLTVRDIKAAVVEGDVKRLSSVSGIGKKMAERMVVELRDRISSGEALEAIAGDEGLHGEDARTRDAVLALISLGYKQANAQKLIIGVAAKAEQDASVEDVVRLALAGSA